MPLFEGCPPARGTDPHGAAPHDYRCLLKVLYHRVFPRKKQQGGSRRNSGM